MNIIHNFLHLHFLLVEFLQKQLKNLKDSLKKCLDKRNQMSRSGAAAESLPKCKYFEQMRFLHDKSANKPTVSNLGICTNEINFDRESSSTSLKRKTLEDDAKVNAKNRRSSQNDLDTAILKQIQANSELINKSCQSEVVQDDDAALYCKSIVPILRSLPVRKRRLATLKISKILFDLEFEDDNDMNAK